MKMKIKDVLDRCGVDEQMYPGKRVIKRLPQPGENKSHSVVFDWRRPDQLLMEIKAGLFGKSMAPKDLKKYPLSFQSPTYVEFAVTEGAAMNADENEDEDEDGGTEGKAGSGGGQAPKKRILAFSEVVRGRIPAQAEVTKIVLMGKEIAKGAYDAVLGSLMAQVKAMSVAPVNLLASVTHVTKIAPGGRSPQDIDPGLMQGVKPYKPRDDMFGPPPTAP